MLSVGADTHRANANTGIHQGPIGFVSSWQLSVQQGLRVPIHIDDLNEVLGEQVRIAGGLGRPDPVQLQGEKNCGQDKRLAQSAQPNQSWKIKIWGPSF